jgi:TP901 family phage tail tape measure protein
MAKIILNVDLNSSPAQKELKALENAIKGIASTLSNVKADKNLTAQINALTKNYTALANAAQKVTKETAKANTAESKETKERVKATQATENLSNATKNLSNKTKANTNTTEKNTKSTIQSTSAFLKSQIRMEAYSTAVNLLKSAFTSLNQTLVQTEDAVIALQRVLPEGSATDSQIADDLYNMAQQYGQAFDSVQQATQNFAKAGLDYEDSLKATQAALVAVNVAELDVTQATEGMIAIMTQFGYTADDLMDIVDMLNKVGDQYAVSSDKLLTALQRTGSTAANANLSLEETIGLVTALSEATGRSGENIGTAVNSLIQYTRKASSLDVFAQLSDGAAQAVEDFKLGGADILDVWREVSVAIGDMSAEQENLLNEWISTDEMQSLTQELHDELGDIFETTQDVYGTANTYRQNYFIALLKNMDTVMEATQTAQNAQGYSQAENEKYMQTYTAQVTALTAQWQHLVSEEQGFLNFKKNLVEFGSSILTVIENTGGLSQLLKELAVILGTIFTVKHIDSIKNFVINMKLATQASNLAVAAQEAQNLAQSAQDDLLKYLNNSIINSTELRRKETIATNAQTAATNAQAMADQAAATSANLKNLAIGVTVSALIGLIALYKSYLSEQTQKRKEEEQSVRDEAKQAQETLDRTKENIETLIDFEDEIKNSSNSTEDLAQSLRLLAVDMGKTGEEIQGIIEKYEDLNYEKRTALELTRKELLLEQYQQKKQDSEGTASAKEKEFLQDFELNRFARSYDNSRNWLKNFLERIIPIITDQDIFNTNANFTNVKEVDTFNKFLEKYKDAIDKVISGNQLDFDFIDELYNIMLKAEDDLLEIGKDGTEAYEELQKAIYWIKNSGYLDVIDAYNSAEYATVEYDLQEELIKNPIEKIEDYINKTDELKEKQKKGTYTAEEYGYAISILSGLYPDYANAIENGINTTKDFESQSTIIETKLDDLSNRLSSTSNAFNEFSEKGFIGYDTLSELREQFGKNVPEIENYIKELAKGDITAEEVEKTLSDLTKAYIENTISTDTMAASNVDVISSLLKEKGVLNSVEMAQMLVAQAKVKAKVATMDLSHVTDDNLESLFEEASATNIAREQLAALIAQETIFNNTSLDTDDKIKALERLSVAYGISKEIFSKEYSDFRRTYESQGYTKKEINEMFLQKKQSELVGLFSTDLDFGNSTTTDTSSQTDEYLESLKDIVELRQSELSLLEKQDRPISEQIAKQYEIKAALQDELNYLISIGEDQVEINNLRGQLLDIDSQIVDLRKQEYEERRSYLENELSLMEAQDKNYQEQTAKIREIQEVLHLYADYLRSIGASQEEINDLSIDWLDYMEQIQQLQIDYYESERSLLESQIAIRKNQASIDEIISMYQKEQDLLHQQAEYLRLIGAEQEEINNLSSEWYNIQQDIESLKDDALQNALEAATKPIEEEINLREEAKQQEEEQLDIEEKKKAVLEAQKKLLDTMAQRNVRVYNTATGQWEWQSNAQDIQDAKEELENAQKEYDDAIYDEQTNLLQEQVDWAEKIYEKIQDGDATNEEIIELMKFFSGQWSDSDEEGKKFLHDANIVLGSIIGATYDDATGTWTNSSSHAIFSEIGSAISANKNEDGVWIPVDVTKVRDTIGNFDVEKLMRQYEIEKNNLVNPMQYIQSFNNGRTYNTNSGNTTSYSLNGVTIPQNASKELAEVLTKIFDDMKLYGN